jgi:putative ABC transport system permease protein
MAETGATAWRWLIAGEFRAFPMRFVLAGLAIAIGVALAFAVHVINRSAAESFGRAVRSAAGGSDLQVRGASALGFDESLYPKLMAHSVVADASPVVQLRAMIGEQERPVPLLGLDIFRTQTVSQSLVIRPRLARIGAGTRSTDLDALLDQDALYLSRAAMTQSGLDVGHRVDVRANGQTHNFVMAGDLPAVAPGQELAVIDIASAQWRFGRLGTLTIVST